MRHFLIAALITITFVASEQPLVQAQTIATAPITTPDPPAAPGGARLVSVPGGTPVIVQMTDKVSSATAKVGDTFSVRVANDVVIDGYVVIAKDAGGQGEVLAVDRAGSHGHAGSLGIQIDWAYAVSGEKVRLSSQRKTNEGENKAGVASTMTILSWALLGPVGLFAHNWVKGHDLEIDGSHPLQAYVDDTVHINSSRLSVADSGFAH